MGATVVTMVVLYSITYVMVVESRQAVRSLTEDRLRQHCHGDRDHDHDHERIHQEQGQQRGPVQYHRVCSGRAAVVWAAQRCPVVVSACHRTRQRSNACEFDPVS
jgi:hypothetical protein